MKVIQLDNKQGEFLKQKHDRIAELKDELRKVKEEYGMFLSHIITEADIRSHDGLPIEEVSSTKVVDGEFVVVSF